MVASVITIWPICRLSRHQYRGRIRLSMFANIPDRPEGDEADVLEPHTINAHYVAAMLFFVVFGDNVVRWIEGSETSHWFWLLSGEVEALTVFGVLSVLALFSYWSRLGRALKDSD